MSWRTSRLNFPVRIAPRHLPRYGRCCREDFIYARKGHIYAIGKELYLLPDGELFASSRLCPSLIEDSMAVGDPSETS